MSAFGFEHQREWYECSDETGRWVATVSGGSYPFLYRETHEGPSPAMQQHVIDTVAAERAKKRAKNPPPREPDTGFKL